MRDLSAHEKHELGKLSKEVEEKSKELAETVTIKEKLAKQLEECQQTLADLQEQVDAALGAEEMVENLTTKVRSQIKLIKNTYLTFYTVYRLLIWKTDATL